MGDPMLFWGDSGSVFSHAFIYGNLVTTLMASCFVDCWRGMGRVLVVMKTPTNLHDPALCRISFICYCLHTVCMALWRSRLGYGAVALMALGQRLPMPRLLATVKTVLSKPMPQMIKFTSPLTLSWAGMHTVTGGSPVLVQPVTGFDNPTSAKTGEEFTWAFRTIGEKAGSYEVEGLPPGVEYSGRVSSGVSSISGTPTEAGSFEVEITGYRGANLTRDKTPVYTLIIEITEGSIVLPTITAHPQSGELSAGDNLTLTVSADGEGLTYQWNKDQEPVDGATEAVFSIEAVQASDAGSYTATVTNAAGSVESEPAEIIVSDSGVLTYEIWAASAFPESVVFEDTVPDHDLEGDGLVNLMEFYLGLDPLVDDSDQLNDFKVGSGDAGVVWSHTVPVNPMLPDVPVLFERSATLEPGSWEILDAGSPGVSIIRVENTVLLQVDHRPGTMMFRLRTPGDEGGL